MKARRRLMGIALLLGFGCASPSRAPAELQAEAPFEFDTRTLEGQSLSVSQFRGKVVLLDVWATWCDPCEESFPFYARIKRELGPSGFEIVAVSVDEDSNEVVRWLEGRNLPFVIGHDPEGRLSEIIGLKTMPSALLLNRQGQVVATHIGFRVEDEPKLEAMIRAAVLPPSSYR